MSRKTMNQKIETAVQPLLTKGEQVRRSGTAWAVESRGGAALLFRARDLHHVVLTDQRLILLTRPRRRRPLGVNNLVIAKKYSTFSLGKARRIRPMLQLRVRTAEGRMLVLEFPPRDRKVGRDLADHLDSNGQAGQPRALAAGSAQPESFPVPVEQMPEAPPARGQWQQADWEDEINEREERTRKEKRAAKKQAKQEAKAAKAAQARKEGNLSRRERRRDEKAVKKAEKKAKKTASDRDEMLHYLQK